MTNQGSQTYAADRGNTHGRDTDRNAGFGDVIGSMLGFAGASTMFALRQMQNAVEIFIQPQGVMNRVRNSLDNISHAMNQSNEEVSRSSGAESFQGSQHRSEPVSVGSMSDPTTTSDGEVMTGRKR